MNKISNQNLRNKALVIKLLKRNDFVAELHNINPKADLRSL